MGAHMARNLQRAGLLHRVWNRTATSAAALAAETALRGERQPPALARALRRRGAVRLRGRGRRSPSSRRSLPALRPGIARHRLLDGIRRHGALGRGAHLRRPGRRFPRCAGERRRRRRAPRARSRSWWAATPAVFERARPRAARPWAARITHFGPHGAGQAAKATNQIIVAGIIRANRRGAGLRARRRARSGQGHRARWARRRRQLVPDPPRPVHGSAASTRPASACACTRRICDICHDDGARRRRGAAGGRGDAGTTTRSLSPPATATRTSPRSFALKTALFRQRGELT